MIAQTLRTILPTGEPLAGSETIHHDGFIWHLRTDATDVFGPNGPALSDWIRDGAAVTIKHGLQRTVYRVHLPTAELFVKVCRANTPRAYIREVFRGAKSRLEFENALALRRLGLPAVEPLAWASRHRFLPADSVFVTRCQPDAVPLQSYLDDTLPTLSTADTLRKRMAEELGRLMARMHDAGVAHPDPHPGNLLLTLPAGQPEFTLIDLHAIRFGSPLSWRASLDNLVLLNRWFQLRASRTDRRRFWKAYVAHRTTLPTACPIELRQMAKAVETRTERSNARFWNGRIGRYTKSNRQFCRLKNDAVSGHAVRDLSPDFLNWLASDPDAPFRDPDARILKQSRTSTVVELRIPTARGQTLAVYKRFNVKTGTLVKNALRPSTALRSWILGNNLLDRGLPTPRPLCVLHRRRGGLVAEGYLLTELVPDAVELQAAVAQAEPAVVRQWADRLGRLIRLMHDRQIAHRDLKAPNILMSGQTAAAEPQLIDLVGVSAGRTVSVASRRRNLARLAVSFVQHPTLTRTDRLRFLRSYLAWGLHGSTDWKTWWRTIDERVRLKIARNHRTSRPLA